MSAEFRRVSLEEKFQIVGVLRDAEIPFVAEDFSRGQCIAPIPLKPEKTSRRTLFCAWLTR
jgi:hypothetical protein